MVITIVILIILSTIVINMAFGDNGLVKYAEQAKDMSEEMADKEKIELAVLGAQIGENGYHNLTTENLLKELNNMFPGENIKLIDANYGIYELIFVDSKKGYRILENGYVKYLSEVLYTDIFVYLYNDGTLAFSNSDEKIEGKTILKDYGNIVFQNFELVQIDEIYTAQTPWINDRENITNIEVVNNIVPLGNLNWFAGCYNASEINIQNIDTKFIVSMQDMFSGCYNLSHINLVNIDTSNVSSMQGMFYNCSSLTDIDCSHFDTSSVQNMKSMFSKCTNLVKVDLSNFNTVNLETMRSMFNSCSKLENIDLSSFDTTNVTSMYALFYNCPSLSSIDLTNFNTSKVKDMNSMFSLCSGLKEIIVSNKWVINKETDTRYMFSKCGVDRVTVV